MRNLEIDPARYQGASVQDLLEPIHVWTDLENERAGRQEVLEFILGDVERGEEPESLDSLLAALAMARLDVADGCYDPNDYRDFLATYVYGPAFATLPYPDPEAARAEGGVKAALADPDAEPSFLAQFANDPDPVVRALVGRNFNTPSEILVAYVLDQDQDPDTESIRFAVAANPATPPDALGVLAARDYSGGNLDDEPNSNVLLTVLMNPFCPAETLRQFATSPSVEHRLYVAGNYGTPDSVLSALMDDGDPSVSTAARSNRMWGR